MAFDTLSYARRLRQAGVPEQQAEAMADATRELVMQDVASTVDLSGVEQRLKSDLAGLEQRLTAAIETQSLRLTVRMGLMLAAGLSLLAAVLRLHS
jgi:hypothetical protein